MSAVQNDDMFIKLCRNTNTTHKHHTHTHTHTCLAQIVIHFCTEGLKLN